MASYLFGGGSGGGAVSDPSGGSVSSSILEQDLWCSSKPRLEYAKVRFLGGISSNIDLDGLRRFYRGWRDFDEYLVLQSQTEFKGKLEKKTIAVKCSKRGNDVYQRRIKRRMAVFDRSAGDVEFFKFDEISPKTNVLFVTLTCHQKGEIPDFWQDVGSDFNKWICNLRSKYGKISYARTWEATKNGYPHIHLMIVFECKFSAFKTVDDEGNFVWRIQEKSEFEKSWPAWVDVRAVRTYSAVIRYLQKRIVEGTEHSDAEDLGDLTKALMWLFRKRAFALSLDLREKLSDLIRNLHNSKSQSRLDGGFVRVVWVVIGIFTGAELGLRRGEWCEVVLWDSAKGKWGVGEKPRFC